ncbi:hypothetical protein ACLESO_28515, partial [Pyxidicoccus sp. 3LG]
MPRCQTCGRRWEGSHAPCPPGPPPAGGNAASSDVPASLPAIPGYQVERLVAHGGFGVLLGAR